MSIQSLPARPNLEQYKKQAKELLRAWRNSESDALARVEEHAHESAASLTTAQLIIAREHGFASWQKFADEIESIRVARVVAETDDPVAAFTRAATVPTDGSDHAGGTLEEADAILAKYPHAAGANIYTAAVLGDEAAVQRFLAADATLATTKGGTHGWDALTYLCFSRYLRLDTARSDAFVRTARTLLEAGANPNTGWHQLYVYDIGPKEEFEAAIYAASSIARNLELTKLLLEFGADINDGETAYHASEGYDNTILELLLKSGKFKPQAMTIVLVRKADWHDLDGLNLALSYGADPNGMEVWGHSGLHHAVKRNNGAEAITALLDHGGDITIKNKYGFSAAMIAARRGRSDLLRLFADRRLDTKLEGVHRLEAACALADDEAIHALLAEEPDLQAQLIANGSKLLAEYAGNGNVDGLKRLLDLGISVDARYEGDGYFEIAKDSTALHVAAWRGQPEAMKLLIERGAPVNVPDGAGRTPLQQAVKACVSSYWRRRRTPEWVEPLLKAGATAERIEIPCGYAEVDALLKEYAEKRS